MTKILRGLLDACSVPELASLIFTFFAISGNRKLIGESLFSYVMPALVALFYRLRNEWLAWI